MSSLTAQSITIEGHGGDSIEAYFARPLESAAPRGGVVVIHHMPGYDRASKEITRRFAEMGYDAICPNLYSREAPGADPDDAAATARAKGGVPDERLVGDVAGAAAHLRALPESNGKVGSIGFCSGGRQSVLAACSLPLDAAVDCYGAFVIGDTPPGYRGDDAQHRGEVALTRLPAARPVRRRGPAPVAGRGRAAHRTAHRPGKEFEFHSYEGAGHAFFAVDRPAYRVEAALDGWEKIADFFGRHLA